MTDVLDLTDSHVRLAEAKNQHAKLIGVLTEWMESGGVSIRAIRNAQFVCYRWEVAVSAEPAKNFTGEIINNIRAALQYVAFQIYLVARGTPEGKEADKVAFPILNTPNAWDSVVTKKVPGVWPEADGLGEALRALSAGALDAKWAPSPAKARRHDPPEPRQVKRG
ncbi:hypothetical protein [Mycobacterium sp.]|uniref:hypothetical protein n=1 Tax=Mycobacterium sp. TaxID=1785 RepID=UPI003D6B704D